MLPVMEAAMAICSIPFCDRPVITRGWCRKHYRRWRTHGSTDDPNDPDIRFARYIATDPNGCVIWLGALNQHGYGRFRYGDRKEYAHRFAYERTHGPVPEGLFLDHLCRVRACINPEHLEATDMRTNTLRGVSIVAINARKT